MFVIAHLVGMPNFITIRQREQKNYSKKFGPISKNGKRAHFFFTNSRAAFCRVLASVFKAELRLCVEICFLCW